MDWGKRLITQLGNLSNRQKRAVALAAMYATIVVQVSLTAWIDRNFPELRGVSIFWTAAGGVYATFIFFYPMDWTVLSVIIGGAFFVIPATYYVLTALPLETITDSDLLLFILYGWVLPGGPMAIGQFLKIANQYKYNTDLRRRRAKKIPKN